MKQAVVPGGEHVALSIVRSLGKKIKKTVISENPKALVVYSNIVPVNLHPYFS